MKNTASQLVDDFFTAIARGELPDTLVTSDMSAWTLTSGDTEKGRFAMGVKLLSSIFNGTLVYTVDALTVEEDRAVAEAQSRGTLINGQDFHNFHVFSFIVRDGKIASVREYMNPVIVSEKIAPLLHAAMAKTGE